MIRRRVQPGITLPVETPSVYEKGGRANRATPFFRTSLGVFAIIFFLFPLLMLAHHLDKLYVHNGHYEPNNRDVTITNNGGGKNPQKKRPPIITIGAPVSNLPLASPNKDRIDAIPYIRYNSSTIKTIKEGMDYASSHGDAENPNNANNTRGQYLLDFGIIGFPKCGTTTMSKFRKSGLCWVESNRYGLFSAFWTRGLTKIIKQWNGSTCMIRSLSLRTKSWHFKKITLWVLFATLPITYQRDGIGGATKAPMMLRTGEQGTNLGSIIPRRNCSWVSGIPCFGSNHSITTESKMEILCLIL